VPLTDLTPFAEIVVGLLAAVQWTAVLLTLTGNLG